ncbi:MAG: hypothetical protein Q8N26_20645 [Myxococcales bacterium]|nr:hypothetical protein [Myxococcales bacterium]
MLFAIELVVELSGSRFWLFLPEGEMSCPRRAAPLKVPLAIHEWMPGGGRSWSIDFDVSGPLLVGEGGFSRWGSFSRDRLNGFTVVRTFGIWGDDTELLRLSHVVVNQQWSRILMEGPPLQARLFNGSRLQVRSASPRKSAMTVWLNREAVEVGPLGLEQDLAGAAMLVSTQHATAGALVGRSEDLLPRRLRADEITWTRVSSHRALLSRLDCLRGCAEGDLEAQ